MTYPTEFSASELNLVKAFYKKAKLWDGGSDAALTSVNTENDSVCFGAWIITKVEQDVRHESILGSFLSKATMFEVTTESQGYSSDYGYYGDVVEVGTEKTLFDALKLCAATELYWELDNMDFTSDTKEEEMC